MLSTLWSIGFLLSLLTCTACVIPDSDSVSEPCGKRQTVKTSKPQRHVPSFMRLAQDSSLSPASQNASTRVPLSTSLTGKNRRTYSQTSIPSYIPPGISSSDPSMIPSDGQMRQSSSTTTQSCHDREDYRSPTIGIPCEFHKGTDCTSWRYVFNENMTALKELIDSCPASCMIPCGAFSLQVVDVRFFISNVSGLLDIFTKIPLEKLSRDYLMEYVASNYIGDITFVLDSVSLKYQERVSRRPIRRGLRDVAEFQLMVILSLMGFSIGVEQGKLSQLLSLAVDSVGFTHAIQSSGLFFEHAEASTSVRVIPSISEFDERDSIEPTGVEATTAIVTVAGVLLGTGSAMLLLLISFVIIRNRLDKNSFTSPELDMQVFSQLSSEVFSEPLSHSRFSSNSSADEIRNNSISHMPRSYCQSKDLGPEHIENTRFQNAIIVTCGQDSASKSEKVPVVRAVEERSHACKIASNSPVGSNTPWKDDENDYRHPDMENLHEDCTLAMDSDQGSNNEKMKSTLDVPQSSTHEIEFVPVAKFNHSAKGVELENVPFQFGTFLSPIAADANAPDPYITLKTSNLSELKPEPTSTGLEHFKLSTTKCSELRKPFKNRRSLSMFVRSPVSGNLTRGDLPSRQIHRSRSLGRSCQLRNDPLKPSIAFDTKIRMVFYVPSGGHLGLAIQSGGIERGSWVQMVQERSPLYGLIRVGDQIVNVDDMDTSTMDSATLSRTIESRMRKDGIIRLVVARQDDGNSSLLPLDADNVCSKNKEGIKDIPERDKSATFADHGDEVEQISPYNLPKASHLHRHR